MGGDSSLITSGQAQYLQEVTSDLSGTAASFMTSMADDFMDRIVQLAGQEVEFETKLFNKTIPIEWEFGKPTETQLRQIMRNQPIPLNKGGKAFTIREWFDNLSDSTVERANGQIRQGLREGESMDAIMRRVRDNALAKTKQHAEALARTGVIHSSNQATGEFYRQNDDLLKNIRVVVTLDSRSCLTCISYDQNNPYPLDNHPSPPFHVNCLPGNSLVLPRGRILSASKRPFNGNLVVIKTTSGREISCTPNHPILTRRGFVSADSIDVGDSVINNTVSQRPSFSDGNNVDKPTPIKEIAESFLNDSEVATRPVPTTAKDFHGDGANSEVAIIGTNRFLRDRLKSSVNEGLSDSDLIIRDAGVNRSILFSSLGTLAFLFKSACSACCSFMSRFNLRLPLFLRHLRPFKFFSLGAAPDVDIPFFKPTSDSSASNIKFIRERLFGHSVFVKLGNLIPGDVSSLAGFNTSFFKSAKNSILRNVKPICNLTSSNAGVIQRNDLIDREVNSLSHTDQKLARQILKGQKEPIEFDEVVEVSEKPFNDYVYNIETTERYYFADGIATHNCRCTTVPVTKSWRELGIDLDEAPEGTRAAMNGQVPESLTYNQWLRSQVSQGNEDIAKEALGARRYNAWVNGDAEISDFVNDSGQQLTLAQIREREGDIFGMN